MNEHVFRLSLRLYQWLLRAYPRGFRELYEADMLLDFEDMYRDIQQDPPGWGIVGFWMHTVLDLMVSIFNERTRHTPYRQRELKMTDTTAFNNQLASTLDFWSRLLRGGYSVRQIIQLAAQNAPEPTASQMQSILDEAEATGNLIDALQGAQARLNSLYYQKVLDVMLEQFKSGGNLADRLDVLTSAFRGEIEVEDWAANYDYNDGKPD